jgi:hypothetical protein
MQSHNPFFLLVGEAEFGPATFGNRIFLTHDVALIKRGIEERKFAALG